MLVTINDKQKELKTNKMINTNKTEHFFYHKTGLIGVKKTNKQTKTVFMYTGMFFCKISILKADSNRHLVAETNISDTC